MSSVIIYVKGFQHLRGTVSSSYLLSVNGLALFCYICNTDLFELPVWPEAPEASPQSGCGFQDSWGPISTGWGRWRSSWFLLGTKADQWLKECWEQPFGSLKHITAVAVSEVFNHISIYTHSVILLVFLMPKISSYMVHTSWVKMAWSTGTFMGTMLKVISYKPANSLQITNHW